MTNGALSERESGAWRGFLRAHARLWKQMNADLEARHGLSLNAYDVLVLLDEAPGNRRRMTDLANAVLMSSGGFTRLADRLVTLGLIERERCATDARGFDAVLTQAGRTKLDEARVTHRADIHERFLAHIDEDEQSVLAGVWERVLEQHD